MLNVCITFDYELFLGKNNAPYREILFEPTKRIIDSLNSLGASGTFFADVCSVFAHKKFNDEDYCNEFAEQLKYMIQKSQDVQLHLHTNWFNAEISNGKIVPGKDGYRIHSLGFGEGGKAPDVIRDGKQYLESICRQVKPDYKCIAYRAGGFSVQPENELFDVLLKNGIRIDSSVVPYMKADTVNYYDFSNVPHKMNWWVDPMKGIFEDVEQSANTMFEVPVATAKPHLLKLIGKSKSKMSLPAHKVLGEYVESDRPPKKRTFILKQYHKLFDYRYVSLDTRYYLRVIDDLEYLYCKYKMNRQDGYICLICHPKLADESRIENIKRLVVEVNKRKDKFAIVNFSDIYNSIWNKTKGD